MLLINKLERTNERYEKAKAEGLIDEKCIPFCDLLNRIGMKTDYCCEGHPFDFERDQNNELFEIVFSSNLPDAEIFAFIELLEEVGSTTINPELRYPGGHFYKWYRSIGGIITDTWTYRISIAQESVKAKIIERELARFQAAEQLYLKKQKESEGDFLSPWRP